MPPEPTGNTSRFATSQSPQILTFVFDASSAMAGDLGCTLARGMQDVIICLQAGNQGAATSRYLLNIAAYSDDVQVIAELASLSDIALSSLSFEAARGTRNQCLALEWAVRAVNKSLDACRRGLLSYDQRAPVPVVFLFVAGHNTGPDITEAARALKNIPFDNGAALVMAIALRPIGERSLGALASRPDMAITSELLPSVYTTVWEVVASVSGTLSGPLDAGR